MAIVKPKKLSRGARALASVFLPFFAIHCVEGIYFVYGNLLKRYGFSSQATGWILGIFFLSMMASRTFGGWTIENFGVRKTLEWSSAVSFAGCMMFFFKTSITALFLGRILTGAAFGVYTMALYSYQAMTASEKERGRDFAVMVCGGILPVATICPIGEWLLIGSMENLFLSIGPILSVVCWRLGRKLGDPAYSPKKKGADEHWGTYGDLLSSKAFLFLIATGILLSMVDAFLLSVSMLAADKGTVASYFLVSVSAVAVFVRVAGAHAINSIPRAVIIMPCGMLMAAAAIFISLFPSNSSFLIGGIVTGLGIGMAWPMYHALISDTLDVHLRPKGTAVALLIYDFGWFLMPLLIGYVSPVLGIASTFMAISLFAMILMALLQFLHWVPLDTTLRRKRKG
jgi:MFS family permease